MAWKKDVHMLQFSTFVYIFSFEIKSSLEPHCHTKHHDKYIFTHTPT